MLVAVCDRLRPSAVLVLRLDYDVDYASALRVRREVTDALIPGLRALIVDLSGCTFADTAGVAELVAAHKLCVASDVLLGVVVPAALTRLFTLAGLDQFLRVFPTLAAAREAIG